MLFNSIEFMIFFPAVFLLYWFFFHDKIKIRNTFILLVSYVFYGWWDWRFLILIVFSSFVDFNIGKRIFHENRKSHRKMYLIISLVANLGLLFYFKYADFFLESFCSAFSIFGKPVEYTRIKLILPVGISFYTFQTLSYTIDIYKRKIKPANSIIDFFAFVSFFPQLVAGPIERASHLLPQFTKRIYFNQYNVVKGFRLILWGMIKKVVIADRLATYVEPVYNNPGNHNSISLIIATVFFAIQIYCDFSGYSDIAIGTAKSLGFDLMTNFRTPYFAASIREFWQRWHISLSTWFRDYFYIPIGGNRVASFRQYLNLMATFLISGLWHGANWTFIIWGTIHGVWFCLEKSVSKGRHRNKLSLLSGTIVTFIVTCFAWIFFRADSVSKAFAIISGIVHFEVALPFWAKSRFWAYYIPGIIILIVVDSVIRFKGLDEFLRDKSVVTRWIIYFSGVLLIILSGVLNDSQFIYFQF